MEDAKKRRRKAKKAVARRKEKTNDDVKERDKRSMRARRAAVRRGRTECKVRGEGNVVVLAQAQVVHRRERNVAFASCS